MSASEKPDPTRAALFLEKLAVDAEEERILAMSDEEILEDAKRKELEGAAPRTPEETIARVLARGEREKAKAAEAKTEKKRDGEKEEATGPGRAKVMRFRRRAGAVAAIAAAAAAAIVGAIELQPPVLPQSTRPDVQAAMLREQAFAKCREAKWGECKTLLDQAKKLDPKGEEEEGVKKARGEIENGGR